MGKTALIKIAVGLAAFGVLGVLFFRSVMDVRAEPYTIPHEQLTPWTVALVPAGASGVLLALRPPPAMAPQLFTQLFTRSGQSLNGPDPVAMPLVLKSEFDRGLAGAIAPDTLVALARESGLESTQPRPLCMASRRVSQPGLTREVFFLRLEHAPFDEFRRQLARRLSAAGGNTGSPGSFDANSLSPVVIVAATDSNFSSWLPLRGAATEDCRAPIVVQ